MAYARDCYTQHSCQRAQLHVQPRSYVAGNFHDAASISLNVCHAEGQSGLIHVFEHTGKKDFMFLPADTQTRLSHKVTERKRFRQALCLALKNRSNLIQQKPRGSIVAGQMMLEFQYYP